MKKKLILVLIAFLMLIIGLLDMGASALVNLLISK